MIPGKPVERNLGSEWDETLLLRLRKAIADLGGDMTETSRGVGGSQEVAEYEILVRGVTITATAETYMGLLLRGPLEIVDEIAELVSRAPGGNA